MKPWPEHHYARVRDFLAELEAALAPAAVPAPAPKPVPAPPPVIAPIPVPPPPAPVIVALPVPPAPSPVPPPPPAQIAPAPAAAVAPVFLPDHTPGPLAPPAAGSAGGFFAAFPWAGGDTARAALAEPDAAAPIRVAPGGVASPVTPADSANPLLAATRSALVTAGKAAAVVEPPPVSSSPSPATGSAGAFFRTFDWNP